MNENQTALMELNLKKLKQPDITTKANSLKSLAFVISTCRNQAILSLQNILNHLEQCLTINENQLNLTATGLLQQIITSYNKEEIYQVIKKKLIKQLIRNLGQNKMQLRKLSHKCLLEFVKKYQDYDTLILNYLQIGIENNSDNFQLKQKCLNSFQSILILEYRYLDYNSTLTKKIFQAIIDIIFNQQQSQQVIRAAKQCITTVCRLRGIKPLINIMSKQYVKKIEELGSELSDIEETGNDEKQKQKNQRKSMEILNDDSSYTKNTLTPTNGQRNQKKKKGIPNQINFSNNVHQQKQRLDESVIIQKRISRNINQDLAEAQQMLKKIQQYKNDIAMVDQIFSYIPTLQSNFNDRRIQLFNISMKMIQVILQIKICDNKFYIRIVPSIVQRLSDQKFLIRNSVNKLIRQYLKNYSKIWIQNFFNSLKKAVFTNYKQDLITHLIYGYETYGPIQFNQAHAIAILSKQAQSKRKNIKNKAIQCIQLIINQNTNPQLQKQIKNILSQELYCQLIGRSQLSTPKFYSKDLQQDVPQMKFTEDIMQNNQKQQRKRMITEVDKNKSVSNEKNKYKNNRKNERFPTETQTSQKKLFKKHQSMQQGYKNYKNQTENDIQTDYKPQQCNPEKFISPNKIKVINLFSPKKANSKLFKDSEGLQYIQKQYLPILGDPKKQSQSLIPKFRDKSWKIQFSALNCTRSLIEYNQDLILLNINQTLQQILKGVLSLRSSISKNSLICLDELITKLKKKLDPFIDLILERVMKKTFYTNQFLQQEIKKCLLSIANNLNESRVINALYHHKQTKSINVKVNILIILQTMIKNEKIYRKQAQTIWGILIGLRDEAAVQIREAAKKNINYIIQNYCDWKLILQKFMKKPDIQKIQEMQKKIRMPKINEKKDKCVLNQKINIQIQDGPILKKINRQQKIIDSPKKYSAAIVNSINQFSRLQQLQKSSRNYKDWKNRINSIIQIYKIAFRFSKQFIQYSSSAKYVILLCQHIDDPNIKVSMNGLNILQQCINLLKPLVQEYLTHILLRLINGMASKKSQFSQRCQQIYKKVKQNIDQHKIVKQLLKLALNPIQKTKISSLKQLDDFVYYLSKQSIASLGPIILKIINKIGSEQKSVEVLQKIKMVSNSLNELMNEKIYK